MTEQKRLQNKPDWTDAPEWAMWLAQDSDGTWFWYESEPQHSDCYFDQRNCKAESSGLTGTVYGDWVDTLERRPTLSDCGPATNRGRWTMNDEWKAERGLMFGGRSVAGEGHTMDCPGWDDGSALNVQEGGDHYKTCKIQPVEYMHANGLGYCEGAVVKYVTRWKTKNGIEDLRKARHFLDLLIELEQKAGKR